MNREEFFEWLETCPSHKWEVTFEDFDYVVVSFRVIDERYEVIESVENEA